ncbi:MAG: hypothetical protein ACI3WT_07865 [Phascolarctobacterium sp.]
MKILISKFNLKHEGKVYPAGSIVDLPTEIAMGLVQSSPKEFTYVDVPPAAVKDQELDASAEDIKDEDVCLDNLTVEELKRFAADNDINIGKATRKADIIAAIVAAGEQDAGEQLPDVDMAEVVK